MHKLTQRIIRKASCTKKKERESEPRYCKLRRQAAGHAAPGKPCPAKPRVLRFHTFWAELSKLSRKSLRARKRTLRQRTLAGTLLPPECKSMHLLSSLRKVLWLTDGPNWVLSPVVGLDPSAKAFHAWQTGHKGFIDGVRGSLFE